MWPPPCSRKRNALAHQRAGALERRPRTPHPRRAPAELELHVLELARAGGGEMPQELRGVALLRRVPVELGPAERIGESRDRRGHEDALAAVHLELVDPVRAASSANQGYLVAGHSANPPFPCR